MFEEKHSEQGRNFSNKLWNALRLIKGWEITEGENPDNKVIIEWLESKLNKTLVELDASFKSFRLSEALMTVYKLIWDDFCSWYLELIKPDYQKPIDRYTYDKTIALFEKLLQTLHPFMPFVTEEIWHIIGERKEGTTINLTSYPAAGAVNENLVTEAEIAFDIIINIRDLRARANKKNTETVDAFYLDGGSFSPALFSNKIIKLARLGKFEKATEELQGKKAFLIKGQKFFVDTGEVANVADERKKLTEELEYAKGFLASVEKKLSNEKFVGSAPAAVVEAEKQKRDDALNKIALLEKSLSI